MEAEGGWVRGARPEGAVAISQQDLNFPRGTAYDSDVGDAITVKVADS
jgi:hypothetical protein